MVRISSHLHRVDRGCRFQSLPFFSLAFVPANVSSHSPCIFSCPIRNPLRRLDFVAVIRVLQLVRQYIFIVAWFQIAIFIPLAYFL